MPRVAARFSVRPPSRGIKSELWVRAVRVRGACRLGNTPRVVQEVYAQVIPADDQAAAQVVGDLFRQRGVTNV